MGRNAGRAQSKANKATSKETQNISSWDFQPFFWKLPGQKFSRRLGLLSKIPTRVVKFWSMGKAYS